MAPPLAKNTQEEGTLNQKVPKASIIIVTYNGLHWLKGLLPCLEKQSYPNYEVIIVDNASTDSTKEFLEQNYPQCIYLRSAKNNGFAEANNIGVRAASGEFFILLNNDTIVSPSYVAEFVNAAQRFPNAGVLQSKILLLQNPGMYDVCGSYWTDTTFLYHYGYHKPVSKKYERVVPVFSGLGASLLIRKEVVDEVGLFDSSFWAYYEETDFCHRVWLAGYECLYVPVAPVLHAKGGTSSSFRGGEIYFHNIKNKVSSYCKNFSVATLIWVLPVTIALQILVSFYFLFSKRSELFFSTYSALFWVLKNLRRISVERNKVQRFRFISDAELFRRVRRNPFFSYYWYALYGLESYDDA